MSDPNHRQRSDPALSQSYRYEDHSKSKGPREQSPYSRDTNRHDERQDNGDRVRTSRTHKNEHRCPEKTATQDTRHYRKEQVHDRPHEHKPRNGKETSRERHREDRSRQERHPENRSVDQKNENHDGNRVDKSRKQKYPEDRHFDREESSLGRQREERRLDQLELNLHKGEGSQKRYWEERSLDKHRVYSSHAVDRYWGDESPSIPRNSQEINFHQESSYDKRTVLPMSYGPHPQSPYFDEREYYESQPEGGVLDCNKCRYLCTGRACCQFVEVLLNMLILVCASVSYNSTGGFTGITNMGGIYYYAFGGAYSGFDGADGDTAQKLDVQFYQLKLPTVSATMAFGGALMGFSCLMVLIGVFRLPWHFPVWLLVECILDSLISCGYLPALYFYFRKLLDAYETQICKDRETLYKSKGYPGFSCALHGADIAAGLFGCMAIVAFALSAVLAVRGFRRVRHMKSLQQSKLEL